jgi:hypothetical protein
MKTTCFSTRSRGIVCGNIEFQTSGGMEGWL